MKNLFILILGIYFGAPSIILQEPVSSVVNVEVPQGAVKLDHTEMMANSQKIAPSPEFKFIKSKNLFKIENTLLAFWDLEVSEGDEKSLSAIRMEMLEVSALDKMITVRETKIVKLNGHEFFIFRYRNGEANYIRFMSEYKKQKAFSGILQFEDADLGNADQILIAFIKSVKFK